MINRSDLRNKVTQCLAGTLTEASLAAWAFDIFYAEDMGEEEFAEQDSDMIRAVLDDLMFADDKQFRLDESDLRRMLVRLQ